MTEEHNKFNLEELVEKNVETINALIEKYGGERKEEISATLASAENFFLSPASSREDYHDAHIGGLAKHSIEVFFNLLKLDKVFAANLDKESMLIVALFHDFGKCQNSNYGNFYEPVEDDWKKKKGFSYELSYGSTWMTTRDRTVFLLSNSNLKLKPEEFQAILLNDGQYIEENKGYKMKESKLALLLHMADRMTANSENF